MASKFEYKVVSESFMTGEASESLDLGVGARLNTLGEAGWELVLLHRQESGPDLWIFKRPAGALLKAADDVAASLQKLLDRGHAMRETPGRAEGADA